MKVFPKEKDAMPLLNVKDNYLQKMAAQQNDGLEWTNHFSKVEEIKQESFKCQLASILAEASPSKRAYIEDIMIKEGNEKLLKEIKSD